MARISWRANGGLGAVIDFDLSKPPSEAELAELRALFDRHRLLVFEGQKLTYDDQVEVCSWFGPACREKRPSILSPDPELGSLGAKELAFHTDNACTEEPLEAISLHALDVDAGETSTLFVDAIAAAERLPRALRRRLDGLHALHLWPTLEDSSERKRGTPPVRESWPGAEHPVVLVHPRTGKEILYVSAGQTERIVELEAQVGETLIRELFGYLYDAAPVHEHVWKTGDFLIWDNLAIQHGRRPVPAGVKRAPAASLYRRGPIRKEHAARIQGGLRKRLKARRHCGGASRNPARGATISRPAGY